MIWIKSSSTYHAGAFSNRVWLALCAAVIALWFIGLGYRPLMSPDEGRYSEIAREMAQTGDIVTPRLNGLKYFEKPPLQYWLSAASFRLFGESDSSARLVTALYGLGTPALLYLCLMRLGRRPQAQLAFLLAAGTCWIAAMGHFVSLDMGLTFWLTMTACGLVACLDRSSSREGGPAPLNGWPDRWVWIGMAGGFLSKGLVAGVIPVAALLLTAAWLRQPRLLLAVRWIPGVLIFAAIVLPWLIAIQIANPGFFEFFFIREHFQRFTSEVHRRVEPWWYFIPVLLMGGLPWLGHWLAALGRHRAEPAAPPEVILLAWSVFVFMFFSASGSKLPSYILPVFPCLALWLALRAERLSPRALRMACLPPLAAAVLLAMTVAYVLNAGTAAASADGLAAARRYAPWILFACLTLAAAAMISWRQAHRGFRDAMLPLALGMLLATQLLQWGHATQAESMSGKRLAAQLLASEPEYRADTPFYSVGTYDQTLPFYLKRTITLVEYRDEMDMGLREEPGLYGPSAAELLAQWSTLPRFYALVDHNTERRWQAAGVGLRVVARSPRRTIVTNR